MPKVWMMLSVLLIALGCSSSKKKPDAGALGTGNSGTGQATAGGGGKSAGAGTGGKPAGTGGKSAGSGGSAASTGGKSAGTGGSSASSGGSTSIPAGGNSVLERNNHPSRDGHFMQPMLTKAAAAKLAKDAGFNATFMGKMYASPVYLENGPNGKGIFIAVTTSNDVLAFDETTGAMTWKHNIGGPPSASGAGCGNVNPLGILSTPAIDPASRTIFVAGAIGSNSIMRHEVHALSADDGSERSGWPVDVAKVGGGGMTFDPPPQNQRSALSIVGGTLYVAYGGHAGDCGGYHGWVFGIDVKDPTKAGGWPTLGRGEGIWAAGGMASDGNGVFVLTGNNTSHPSAHDGTDSEEAVRITGLGTLDRSDANIYYPKRWQTMDSQDADLGASSPVYIEVPGATPSKILVAIAKDGHVYLLDAANLGGMGGQKVDFMVSNGAMSIHTVPAAYTTAKGVHVVFSTDAGATGCPSGGASGQVVMSLLIAPGSPPAPSVAWCTQLSGPVTTPMATTTDGKSEAIVWYMNNGKLTGVDGDTGAAVFTSSDSCSGVRQWTSPIAVKGHVVAGGDNHLCSWSPQ